MLLFELISEDLHIFSNTLVHINKNSSSRKSENYFYVVDTKCQMAMLHYHKQDSKNNRVVN